MIPKQIQFLSASVEQTQAFAELIGKSLESGMVFLLFGDLGSGKTAFVQGLAKGLEVSEKCYITSPTYTLVNEYPGRIPILHVDLYRLSGPDDFEDIGFYDMLSDTGHVLAVEWADRIEENFSEKCLTINIRILKDNKRSITLSSNVPENNDLIERIDNTMKEQKWG